VTSPASPKGVGASLEVDEAGLTIELKLKSLSVMCKVELVEPDLASKTLQGLCVGLERIKRVQQYS
jgi:hypothetical protein